MKPDHLRHKLLQSLDIIIKNGRWESSLFLKNILKRLEQMRNNLQEKVEKEEIIQAPASGRILDYKEGYEKVYIELYQAACEDLEKWATTIKSLAGHHVSRPVYRNESHVQELIRSKRSRADAYVSLWVKSSDILLEPGLQDRFGHELVKLREKSVDVENIINFVHDKISYNYIDNTLIRDQHAST